VLAAGVAGLTMGGMMSHREAPPRVQLAAQPGAPPIRVGEPAPVAAPPPLPAPVQVAHAATPRAGAHAAVREAHATRRHPAHKPRVYAAHVRICAGVDWSERAWCSHRAVMAADGRLREAWRTAQRAGVPPPVLAAYRDRWEGLRHRALSDPDEVVAGYGEMASDLSRMAVARRRVAPRRGRGWWLWG
jgi:hypothetical protein